MLKTHICKQELPIFLARANMGHFHFFKEIKKLITIYYINTSYYHLDVYIIMQTWPPPPFFFWKPIFFLSHISILKLPHPCFFDRVCRMQKVLIFPRWQTYGVKLFLETIYLTKRNKIASACRGLNLGPLVYNKYKSRTLSMKLKGRWRILCTWIYHIKIFRKFCPLIPPTFTNI